MLVWLCCADPVNNGGKTDKYTWSQSLSEVNVEIALPAGTTSKQLQVTIEPTLVHATLKGSKQGDAGWYLSGEPDERVDSDNATWTLVADSKSGGKILELFLPKANKMSGWWKRVVKGDPAINTKKVVPENSKLEDLDGDTRGTVEKMMVIHKARIGDASGVAGTFTSARQLDCSTSLLRGMSALLCMSARAVRPAPKGQSGFRLAVCCL